MEEENDAEKKENIENTITEEGKQEKENDATAPAEAEAKEQVSY